MPPRSLATLAVSLVLLAPAFAQDRPRADRLHDLQDDYVAHKDEKRPRAYHFGAQGPGDVFSNHTSHSNRLIPVYVFGTRADLAAVTGANSRYRDASKIKELYGVLPEHTLNPKAEYADQSDLYRVQKDAIDRGAKYVFTVWFDGLDWPTTRAAAIARTGSLYHEGPGSGLIFQDYDRTPLQFGFVVTSPTHDKNDVDVDEQTVTIPKDSLVGGYDARIAGPNPWTHGPLEAPGYLKGQSGTKAEKARVAEVGGALHAYTDSSSSAGEYATGVKQYNNGVNVADDGRFVPTLYNKLQAAGWKVGTVTSVPFDHASPAAMYAHNVHRDDYQDLARDMLGLEGIGQQTGKDPRHPGLDVVIGCGFGVMPKDRTLTGQGKNADPESNTYLADADAKAIRVENGGRYVVAQRTVGAEGSKVLLDAAERAAEGGHKLFGFFGGVGRPPALPHRQRRLPPRPRHPRHRRVVQRRRPRREPHPRRHDPRRDPRSGRREGQALRPLRRGRRRRFRPPRQQPRQRRRRPLQRRGRHPGHHRLGREEQQLGRVRPDRHRRPRPLPRDRRPEGPRGDGKMSEQVARK